MLCSRKHSDDLVRRVAIANGIEEGSRKSMCKALKRLYLDRHGQDTVRRNYRRLTRRVHHNGTSATGTACVPTDQSSTTTSGAATLPVPRFNVNGVFTGVNDHDSTAALFGRYDADVSPIMDLPDDALSLVARYYGARTPEELLWVATQMTKLDWTGQLVPAAVPPEVVAFMRVVIREFNAQVAPFIPPADPTMDTVMDVFWRYRTRMLTANVYSDGRPTEMRRAATMYTYINDPGVQTWIARARDANKTRLAAPVDRHVTMIHPRQAGMEREDSPPTLSITDSRILRLMRDPTPLVQLVVAMGSMDKVGVLAIQRAWYVVNASHDTHTPELGEEALVGLRRDTSVSPPGEWTVDKSEAEYVTNHLARFPVTFADLTMTEEAVTHPAFLLYFRDINRTLVFGGAPGDTGEQLMERFISAYVTTNLDKTRFIQPTRIHHIAAGFNAISEIRSIFAQPAVKGFTKLNPLPSRLFQPCPEPRIAAAANAVLLEAALQLREMDVISPEPLPREARDVALFLLGSWAAAVDPLVSTSVLLLDQDKIKA